MLDIVIAGGTAVLPQGPQAPTSASRASASPSLLRPAASRRAARSG